MNKMNEETEKKEIEIEEVDQVVEENSEAIDDVAEESESSTVEINDKQRVLSEEVVRLKDEIIRLHAEADNVKKRNARELDNLRKFALDKFAKSLLPVADSMDKELEANEKDGIQLTVEQMVEGTILTQNVLLKVLKDNGVEVINPDGEKFNPEFHEAMTQVPNPDLEPNTIVDVFQKGYLLNGRLIRPAMVVVSK
ncbi:MAG: nucleotide exchange factor GrpE [Marinicellaceae bacterium]